jgi:hypothetical protein
MARSSLLSDLVDLQAALAADDATDFEHRKQRDRRIGQELQAQRPRPARQLRCWLEQVQVPGWSRHGQRAVRVYRLLGMLLLLTGLITGWGYARAILHYTGEAPINIVNALGLLVLPQVLLLVLWLLAALPHRLPLLGGLRSTLRFLNPGRLAAAATRLFPVAGRQGLETLWDRENAVVLAPAARWLFSLWSQLFAFCFNIGLLLAFAYLITFSDLAFAWSTTLAVDSAGVHRALQALSWPWHRVFPDGVPGAELVEISRYYRLDEGTLAGGTDAAGLARRLGDWWPFLIAAIVCYGLLPRLATLAISWLRFRHHLAAALPRLPGSPELLARMNSPLVSTAAHQPETVLEVQAGPDFRAADAVRHTMQCEVVAWSGAAIDVDGIRQPLRAMGVESLDFHAAGGRRTTTEDRATITALCRQGADGVAIIVKAWEPPLLEFVDFVREIRRQCDRRQPILVLLRGDGGRVDAIEQETWRLTMQQLKDPDLHIEVLGSTP